MRRTNSYYRYLSLKVKHIKIKVLFSLLLILNAYFIRAKVLGLPHRIVEMVPGKPVFLMTWEGEDPSLPSLLLNSHTDVVPVYPDQWKHDPFEAVKEENGDIYARGTQVNKMNNFCYYKWRAISDLQK